MCESMLCLLDLGAVGDGHRPILNSGMNGHVTLPPFLFFFRLEHAPTNCSVKYLNGLCM